MTPKDSKELAQIHFMLDSLDPAMGGPLTTIKRFITDGCLNDAVAALTEYAETINGLLSRLSRCKAERDHEGSKQHG